MAESTFEFEIERVDSKDVRVDSREEKTKTKKTLSVKSRLQTFRVDSCTNKTKEVSVKGIRIDSGVSRVDSPQLRVDIMKSLCIRVDSNGADAVSLHFLLLLVYILLDGSTLLPLAVSPANLCLSHRYTLLGGRQEEAVVAPEKKKENDSGGRRRIRRKVPTSRKEGEGTAFGNRQKGEACVADFGSGNKNRKPKNHQKMDRR
ncbi:hypothetical protein PIB30_103141 [Stylosanthes scabra]|uniref:Uncharacterized protein n=1 Tax=Stylosanthes scabra TaxID=79078 RepID=A0ABU6SY71_9FABA|nr:hypothetical protein [Stylosanthes scabra]